MKAFTGTAAAGVALALLVACTPGVTAPSPSPTPTAATTPAETPLERQTRLDYAAAEEAFRTFNAEVSKLLQAGGAAEASATMKRTAAGSYLQTYTTIVRAFKERDARQTGSVKIVSANPAGYSPTELNLTTCEDGSGITIIQAGKRPVKGEVRTGMLIVKKVDGLWKLWSATGEKAEAC